MGIRADLKADGDACRDCGTLLWNSTSIAKEHVLFLGSEKITRWKGVAVLAKCSGCGITNIVPWMVST